MPFREEERTGSGVGIDSSDTGNMLTPISSSNEQFSVVADEQVGQLYAYRINDSAVVLGTRSARSFGASIGIESIAAGDYQCLAANVNARNIFTISISVQTSKLNTVYNVHS